ncbi:ubiquitin interaction domain-containing protein, partial [Dactylonectria estremocensis]
MASMEPSEQEISQVIDFASLSPSEDRSLVTQALKFRQKYQSAWDDSMFAAERDGTNNNAGISFHIESPDHNSVIQGVTPPPDSYPPGAPSRPPSRTNNRSPLGRIVDWTTTTTTGITLPQLLTTEDEDMQRALRESAQEAGIDMVQPEPNIMEPSASAPPNFGPANRNDYDQDTWAMVPVGPTETNLGSAPVPSLRKRAPGAPAFLIQGNGSAGDHRLGSLITILHEIPLARNVLLDVGSPAASYGHNREWWKGQEILPPHVLAQLQTGELQWGQQGQVKTDFEEEIHRLMAFLDSTDRSYGTVSVLADLIPFSNLGPEKLFYEQLGERQGEKIRPLMQIASLTEVHGDDLGYEDAKFGLLEMDHLRSEYGIIKTLYESLDHVMWNDVLGWNEVHESSKMAMFKEVGDVFVVKVSGDGPEDSMEIPEVFYPEKYMISRKDEARRIQIGWCKSKREMTKIVEERDRIYQWRDNWTNQVYDKRDLIKKAADQWTGYSTYLQSLARFEAMEKSGFDTDEYPDYRAAPCELDDRSKERLAKVDEVIQFSERLLTDLEARVKGKQCKLFLNEFLLESIKARQRFLGKLLTTPEKPGRPMPMTCNKYLLRGVATSSNVVYVCQRAEADLIELEDEPSQPSDQWWRLAYAPSEEQPVKAEKIEIERLFRDMWQETKTPILVYATEKALGTARAPLTSPLERFVKAENKAFRQELNQEKSDSGETRRAAFVEPLSPSKRKHRSDSADSMDSNRASLGSDDRNGFDNPFADQDESVGT